MRTIQIVLIILYLLLVLFFSYMTSWKSGSWQKGLYTLVICVGFPGVGFGFLWICGLLEEKRREKDFSEFYQGEEFSRDNLHFLHEVEKEKEMNQVAMSEALVLNQFEYRRNMVMQLLNEEDTLHYLEVLQDALDNDDTETSHYASTVIMELQRKVQEELIEKEMLYEKNQEERQYAVEWEEILYKILGSKLYDEQNRKRYFVKYKKVSDDFMEENCPMEQYLYHKIQVLFMEKNYTEASQVCRRYLDCYPESENAVLCQLEAFIKAKDYAGMKEFLKTMSERPVILTQKTLKYIRFFREE